MADGSIIIDTRIDTGGVSKGMNAVKAGMTRISAQVSKMGDSAKSSFQRQITAITDLYQKRYISRGTRGHLSAGVFNMPEYK